MISLYSSGPSDCHSSEAQTPTWAPRGGTDYQGDPSTSPDHKAPTKAASTRTPRPLKATFQEHSGPHLARGSGLEWGLPAVIPGRALPALLFKSAGERKNSNNKKGAAERRGPAVTNAVTQGPLPPQVLIILAPPAEPPHRSRAGDTTAPRPAVLGVSSPNPPAVPARRPSGSFPTGAVAVLSPRSGTRRLRVTGRVVWGERGQAGLALWPALAQRLASPLQRRAGLGRVYNTRR